MADIFISYAREDEARIQHLVRAIEEQGWSVFWDRRIPAGKSWRNYLGQALNEARCVIVAWSHHSIDSQWVTEEADEGQKRSILVPVLLDAVEPPIGFRSIHAADLTQWAPDVPSPRFKQLIHDIQTMLGSHAPVPAALTQPHAEVTRVPPETRTRISKRFAYPLLALILAAVAAISYRTYQERHSDSPNLQSKPSASQLQKAEMEPYRPRLEIASGATVNGVAKKIQLIEQSERNPQREEILTTLRVLEQFLSKSEEKSKQFDSKVYAYESLLFRQETSAFTARSSTFRGQQRTGTQHSAFLVSNGKPESIRFDISENGDLALSVPAAKAGDSVLLLLWVWSEKGTLTAGSDLKFEVD